MTNQAYSKAAGRLAVAVTLLLGLLLLSACGGGGGSEPAPDPGPTVMQIGQVYELSGHASVVSTSMPAAQIEVRHDLESDRRTVTLLAGSADIFGAFVSRP